MGVTFQVFAVSPSVLGELQADSEAADEYCQSRYGSDPAGESIWLDKSGMGILEAFGVVTGEAQPPALWILGDGQMQIGSSPCPFLTADQLARVAEWASRVTDEEFRTLAGSNVLDTDVDYLSHFFGQLRDFYQRASSSSKAAFTYISY
jgi:hypothetical protein